MSAVKAWLAVSVLVACAGCATSRNRGSQAADEQAIRDVVDRTMAAVVEKDMAKYVRYYGPNAAHVLPDLPITYGESKRRRDFPPGYAVTMRTEKVEVSGDMGYAFGDFKLAREDTQTGELKHSTGKWMTVFKRQPDGSWGAVADTHNVDTTPPKQ